VADQVSKTLYRFHTTTAAIETEVLYPIFLLKRFKKGKKLILRESGTVCKGRRMMK